MRGDVHRLRAPRDAVGHEQRGTRYAVVLQSDLLPLSTWLVAPTSTTARPASFGPEIDIDGTPTLVLAEQMTAVDPQRLGPCVGRLLLHKMAELDAALRTVLDLR